MSERGRPVEPEAVDGGEDVGAEVVPVEVEVGPVAGVAVTAQVERQAVEAPAERAGERREDVPVEAGGVREQERGPVAAEIVDGDLDAVGRGHGGAGHGGRGYRRAADGDRGTSRRGRNDPVQQFLSNWGYVALLVLTIAEAACIPIPSEVTLGFAGYLASTGKLNLALVILVGTIGETIGSYVGWSIGRFGGRPLVDKAGKYVLLSHSDLDRAEAWFSRRGEPAVFFGRLLPLVRTFISIPAGLAEMKLVRFGVATFFGSLIWCSAIAITGYELGGEWSKMTKGFAAAGYIVAAVVLVVFVVFVMHRYSVVRRDRARAAAGGEPAPEREHR